MMRQHFADITFLADPAINPVEKLERLRPIRRNSEWNTFMFNQDQDLMRGQHTKKSANGVERFKSMGLGKMVRTLSERPLNQSEMVVTQVFNTRGQRRWAIRNYSTLAAAFIDGDAMFLNEYLGSAVKAYFDIDLITGSEKDLDQWDAAYEATANRVIGKLSEHAGFSSDWNDWVILVCPYIGHTDSKIAKKLSMHFIYRRWKFTSPTMLGKFIREKLTSEVIESLHIDMQVYDKNQNMRGLGMSKFVATKGQGGIIEHYPFLSFHPPLMHSEYTQELYVDTLIQNVRGCHEIHVDGQSQEALAAGAVSSNNRLIDAVLLMFRLDGEELGCNSHCQAFAISESTIDSNHMTPTISFKVENYEGFRHCEHISQDVEVKIYVKAETFRIDCTDCPCGWEYGLTCFSEQMAREMRWLKFASKHGFDRPDFPLEGTASACGHFGLSTEEHWKERKAEALENTAFSGCNCSWCLDPSMIVPLGANGEPIEVALFRNPRNPSVMARDTFYWIQKRYPNKYDDDDLPYSEMMQRFLNMHFCMVESAYYIRSVTLEKKTQADMKEFFGNCQLQIWKEEKKKKKNDPESFYLAKEPIWDHARKHPGLRHFGKLSNTGLDFGVNSGLNTLLPIELDVNYCRETFNSLMPAEQAMLRNVYISMMRIFTYNEPDAEIRREAEHYLHRWTNACLFQFNEEKHMAVYIVSEESGGQGKSTWGELIGSYLGLNSDLYKSIDGNNAFGDKFNTFVNGLNVINEVTFKHDAQAQEFKSRIMATSVVKRKMRVDGYNEMNRAIYWLTGNFFSKHLSGPGMDRRLMVLKIGRVSDIDAKDLCYFECEECDDPRNCGHSSYCHADLMTIIREFLFVPAKKGEVDLRNGFVGMLHDFYRHDRECYPDKWARRNGVYCPPTQAGSYLRTLSMTVVERYWMECMKRGYHFVVTATPPSSFRGQVFFTAGMKKRFEEACIGQKKGWERIIPIKTLFQAFCWWCQQVGVRYVSCEEFETQTKLFYRTKICGDVTLDKEQKNVYCMEWRKDNTEACKWTPTTNPELSEDCWDLGAGRWKMAESTSTVIRANGDRRAQLKMSRSNHALVNSNSPPFDLQQSYFPLSQQSQSESEGGFYGSRIGNGPLLDEEDPMEEDQFQRIVRVRGRGSSVDEEDEEDVNIREKKKMKSRFLQEVIEGEEEEEQEEQGGFSLSLSL